jgi:hypothetical protein
MATEPADHPVAEAGFTTREEWFDFVCAEQPERPPMPTATKRKRMTDAEQRRLNRQRIDYHLEIGESIVFDTPVNRQITRDVFELIETNRGARGARRAYAISGEPMLGKSTLLARIGKQYELAVRQAYPTGRTTAGHDLIPVVYATLGSEASTKGVSRFIADYYGVPTWGVTDVLTGRIRDTARSCGTTLIFIDDIHHLDTRYKDRAAVVDHFKKLLNTVPATFVFAGINAERGALLGGLSGPSSRAVRKRTTISVLESYSIKNRASRTQWNDLLNALAGELLLFDMAPDGLSTSIEPGSGMPMSQYLYERTGGEIGALVDLVKRAANRAIKDGSERITRRLLEATRSPSSVVISRSTNVVTFPERPPKRT